MNPEIPVNPSACADNCGTMPSCAPLAVPYVPYQQSGSKRYAQMEALSNGTLYPALNLPFRAKVNAAAVAQNTMTELQALQFVVQELALYLDTHPNDGEAFELFRQYTELAEAAHAEAAAQHGPILRKDTAKAKTYTWLKGPWPWNYAEGGAK